MKIDRNELKSLIKECLVELLAEGLGGGLNESLRAKPIRGSAMQPPPRRHNPQLDRRVTSPIAQHSALTEAVRASAGGNPIMADILADTAMTTLQSQINAEGRGGAAHGGGDAASLMVANSNPEELFGEETTSKWADLAFASSSPRG